MRFLAAILAGLLLVGGLHSAEGPSFQEREALAKLQAMDIFPDLEKEDSMLAAQVADEVKRLEKEQPAFFKEAAWPLRAARRAAALLGILPRTVAQIRASLTNDFDVDPADLQHIHGIRIVAARFTTGGEWLDVTPQIAALMTERGLAVDCDRALATTLLDERQFERRVGEREGDFWKRQRMLVAAAAAAREGTMALQVTFEFHSERATASTKEGERLIVSEDGKILVSRIAPAARKVGNEGITAKLPVSVPRKNPPKSTKLP